MWNKTKNILTEFYLDLIHIFQVGFATKYPFFLLPKYFEPAR